MIHLFHQWNQWEITSDRGWIVEMRKTCSVCGNVRIKSKSIYNLW